MSNPAQGVTPWAPNFGAAPGVQRAAPQMGNAPGVQGFMLNQPHAGGIAAVHPATGFAAQEIQAVMPSMSNPAQGVTPWAPNFGAAPGVQGFMLSQAHAGGVAPVQMQGFAAQEVQAFLPNMTAARGVDPYMPNFGAAPPVAGVGWNMAHAPQVAGFNFNQAHVSAIAPLSMGMGQAPAVHAFAPSLGFGGGVFSHTTPTLGGLPGLRTSTFQRTRCPSLADSSPTSSHPARM